MRVPSHLMYRQLHSAFIIVPLLSVACATIPWLFPTVTHAEYFESDKQCPAGGQVGQKCKDNTNGYVTEGHCTHINECKADSFPTKPFNTNVRPPLPKILPYPTTSTPYIYSHSTTTYDLLNAAFSDTAQETPAPDTHDTPDTPRPRAAFIYFQGIQYLVLEDEVLKVGDPLTPPPSKEFNTSAFTTFGGIASSLYPEVGRKKTDSDPIDSQYVDSSFGIDTNLDGEFTPSNGLGIVASYIYAAIAFIMILLYVFFRFRRKNPLLIDKPLDPASLPKHVSTKDSSVAVPISTGLQAKTIWENPSRPRQQE